MRRLLAIAVLSLATACGGGRSNPLSPSTGTNLTGRWDGSLTLADRNRPGETAGALTATFTAAAGGYQVRLESANPLLPISDVGTASVIPPGTPGNVFTLDLTYPSPYGSCFGSFNAIGKLTTATQIDTDVLTFESCGKNLLGRLTLSKR